MEKIHEPENQLIFQASMFHTLNPAKSYGKEFFSAWCKASGTFRKNAAIAIQGKDILIEASGDLILKSSKILEN